MVGIDYATSPDRHCSGVLLRNDVILTAQSCVTREGFFHGTPDLDVSHYQVLFSKVALVVPHPSLDLAALVLTEPYPSGDKHSDWSMPIYGGSDASLVGKKVLCYGTGATFLGGGRRSTRASAFLPVVRLGGEFGSLELGTGASGQVQFSGDEGGGCFTDGPNGMLMGIYSHSLASGSSVTGEIVTSSDGLRAWVAQVLASDPPAFVHASSSANILRNCTRLDHPSINGNPQALLYVTPQYAGAPHNHAVGVVYDASTQRWNIFNEDQTPMDISHFFNVVHGGGFVHVANAGNVFSPFTFATQIDHVALNGKPDALFVVTHNFSPGGQATVVNDHPVGVLFNQQTQRWFIFNTDLGAMPVGASFNVWAGNATAAGHIKVAATGLIEGNKFLLSSENWVADPGMKLFVTPTMGANDVFTNRRLGVFFDPLPSSRGWKIMTEDFGALPVSAAFHVLPRP